MEALETLPAIAPTNKYLCVANSLKSIVTLSVTIFKLYVEEYPTIPPKYIVLFVILDTARRPVATTEFI